MLPPKSCLLTNMINNNDNNNNKNKNNKNNDSNKPVYNNKR